ncbi:hypothetical protein [Campylobacter geochelonis]|uniref:hypothetical protein n=1 Tax=Campylobacter geochelonis TaxID=1780362 RepID=UPI000770A286|nr:hypothetical protein [Campylobacter geochelonis]CZE46693.1 Putative periplasmic ATP/GTP-binding protein [Campylobacter geochelonis]
MKTKFIISSLCALAISAFALEVKNIDGFSSPEAVTSYQDGLFVSNVGKKLAPLAKDGDGFISLLDLDGNIIKMDFITGLDAPKGMVVKDGVLYVADIDTLKGFDITTKKPVFNLKINGAVFLNDLLDFDGSLLLSDTGTGIIHQIDTSKKTYKTFFKLDSKLGGPNGMIFKDGELFVATYDPNGVKKTNLVKIAGGKLTKFDSMSGLLDGIAVHEGKVLVSDWVDGKNGVVYSFDGKSFSTLDLPKLLGPADMYLLNDTLYIPQMAGNRLTIANLK